MPRKVLLFVALAFLLLLAACQDAGTLLPQLEPAAARARVASIAQGSILKPGDTIPVSLSTAQDGSQPDAVSIRLYAAGDTDGQKPLAEYTPSAEQVAANAIPPLQLPVLAEGAYRLVFQLSRAGSLLREESISFFCAESNWSIASLAAYPGTMRPGSDGILDLVADVPADSTAWVRWSRGTEVLRSGPLEGVRDRLNFTAPEREGIYVYTVEVFPAAPPAGQNYDFRSACSRDSQVIVAKGSPAPFPDALHSWTFAGTLEDAGREAASAALSAKGPRLFDFQNETVGYRLGDGSSFSASRQLLPDLRKTFTAFSVRVRFMPLKSGPIDLFTTRSADSAAGLSLALIEGGDLVAKFWNAGASVKAVSRQAVRVKAPAEISLSVARLDTGYQLVLECDGAEPVFAFAPLSAASVPPEAPAALASAASPQPEAAVKPSPGPSASPVATAQPATTAQPIATTQPATTASPSPSPAASPAPVTVASPASSPTAASLTEIGSAASAPFILDEFEVYQPVAAAAWDAFYLSMSRRFGNALRYAYDFVEEGLPAGLAAQGDVRVSQGSLIMPAGSSLYLPPVAAEEQTARLEFRFAQAVNDPHTWLQFDSQNMKPVTLGLDGVVRQDDRSAVIAALPVSPLSVTLVRGETGWELRSGEFVFKLRGSTSDKGLTVRLSRGDKGAKPLALVSVTGREADASTLGAGF